MLESYEPIALGELNLTIEQFGDYTMSQISALIKGLKRRQKYTEDLFVIFSALPVYKCFGGKNAPTYEELTAYRNGEKKQSEMDFWRDVLTQKGKKKC
ncbi:MAG: hypothetical protein KBS60_01130 [Phascolarctobacterium sp.]|nr:hypothetical protein [Candidatus Phascolarctobacterium caballi]